MNAVRVPVRPATLWICVVSRASARVIAGRMVESRRVSIDLPTPGRAKKEQIMVRTPASRSASLSLLWLPLANTVDHLWRWEPR
jgi:hypothetical protein